VGHIRTVKPGFFTSKSLARCSIRAMVTFEGLWSEADSHGRGIADPKILKGNVWPQRDEVTWEDVEVDIIDLSREHLVLYEVGERRYFAIPNFHEHQSAAFRRGTAVHPAPPDNLLHAFACKTARGSDGETPAQDVLHTSATDGVQGASRGVLIGEGELEGDREGEGDSADAGASHQAPLSSSALVERWRTASSPPRVIRDRNRAIGIVQQFIDAGHSPSLLEAAIDETPSLSIDALNVAIDKASKSAKPRKDQPIGRQVPTHREQIMSSIAAAKLTGDRDMVAELEADLAELGAAS
jgi:hypothetical protein